jgi:cation diffusion facilitator family transporter
MYRSLPGEVDPRRMTLGPEILMTPQMRSMRLIGNSNPRYRWQRYYKTEEELKKMKKPIRQYYERNNFLIAQYLYIDRLLDSSLPHSLIQEYNRPANKAVNVPQTISEEPQSARTTESLQDEMPSPLINGDTQGKVKRTPKNLYKLPEEITPLLKDDEAFPEIKYNEDQGVESGDPIVTVALYINLAANFVLLIGKIAVIVLTSSLSVLASLVDAALDFLSTAIVWVTTKLIARQDQYAYPIGRRRLEPVGVLVFSVIMITSFFQVALECFSRLTSTDRSIVELGIPAIAILVGTVVIKGFCWLWCRLIKNSSVQALAQDAMTDVVFNTFSIIFPIIGFYARIWWLDALGGLLLSFYVIFNWASTSSVHIRHLTGAAATADQRNVLLYLTMRFAKTIKHIQGIQAYHAGDKLNVEVDIVLDEDTSLKDSHDLSESLQYVLESVPIVDRAFVHADYLAINLPSHMNQQE